MFWLDFIVLDHVIRLFNGGDVFNAVFIGFGVQVVEIPILRGLLKVPEPLAFLVIILRLVDDTESGGLHADKILSAEFPVVAYLPNLKSPLPHVHKPVYNIGVVYSRAVAQGQPAVLRPAKQRDIVLVGLDMGRHNGEKCVGNYNVCPFVIPKQRRRRQVVEFRQVGPAVPVNRHLRQLFKRPIILGVGLAKFLNIKVSLHGVGIDVQRFCEEVLPLLGVILRLERIVQNLSWADAYPVSRVRHFVNFRVSEVHASVFNPFWGAAHENEILLILYGAVQYLPAILEPLPKKRLLIVSCRRYANQQLVRVGLHGLLKQIILLWLLESVDFVTDRNIAVQRILCIRVCRQSSDVKRPVSQVCLHAVLIVIIDNMDMPAIFLVLSHALDVIIQKIEGLQRLHECRCRYVGLTSAPPIPQR